MCPLYDRFFFETARFHEFLQGHDREVLVDVEACKLIRIDWTLDSSFLLCTRQYPLYSDDTLLYEILEHFRKIRVISVTEQMDQEHGFVRLVLHKIHVDSRRSIHVAHFITVIPILLVDRTILTLQFLFDRPAFVEWPGFLYTVASPDHNYIKPKLSRPGKPRQEPSPNDPQAPGTIPGFAPAVAAVLQEKTLPSPAPSEQMPVPREYPWPN